MLRLLPSCTALFALALCGYFAFGVTPAPMTSGYNAPPDKAAAPRLREGETVELVGRIEVSGDRATFHPQEGPPLRVLENLALERIGRVLLQTRDDRPWLVTGLVTEYRGANFLLITKAVQKGSRER